MTFDQQQALSGKKDAVDKEIERLLARERDKSRDHKVRRNIYSHYVNSNENVLKNKNNLSSNNNFVSFFGECSFCNN